MRSLLFLGLGLGLLTVSFKSCSWTHIDSTDVPDAATAVSRQSTPAHKRPFPQGASKPNAYPTAKNESRHIVAAALGNLPKLSATRAEVSKNPHSAPSSLLDGAQTMADMVELSKKGGAAAETAGQFFSACASNNETASAVRAVCLRHYWDLNGNTVSLNDELPERIKKIAAHLPSITR